MKIINFFRKPLFIFLFYLTHPISYINRISQNVKIVTTSGLDKVAEEKVSIIIVTFNALDYVKLCIESLSKTNYKKKEIIVVDNNSNSPVINFLKSAKEKGLIDKLYLSRENTFFSKGNNIGSSLSNQKSKYLVLLNSDVEIKDSNWLKILIANKPKKGVISFGKTDIPIIRPDGWCYLIDRELYLELEGLDETYKMDWSVTSLTAKVLREGLEVKSIINPNDYVYHFGQKSRPKKPNKAFNQMKLSEVSKLFKGKRTELLRIETP